MRYEIPKEIIPHEEHQRIAADRAILATFANVDFQRARFWCLASAVAMNFPRRLGDASPQRMTVDKRLSRKVCHSYRQLWDMFHKDSEVPPPPEWDNWPIIANDPLMLRIGATVMWDRQIDYLANVVLSRMDKLTEFEELATADGLQRWYSRHASILDWELSALQRVKDFMETKQTII